MERVTINVIRSMLARGHACVLMYPEPEGGGGQAPPDLTGPGLAGLEQVTFPLSDAASFYPRTRAVVQNSGVDVLCAMYRSSYIISLPAILNGSGIPLLLSEHIAPQMMETQYWTAYERRACFAAADAIHLLLEEYRQQLPVFLRERVTVIPNAGRPPLAVDWAAREGASPKRILAVGHFFEQQKQLLLLLSAFAVLFPSFPDRELCLCGDGKDRELYRDVVDKAGVADKVHFPGWVDDIDAWYASSHVFCLPSPAECFPLVLLEAERHALPLVGFAACSGTNALIRNGENGLLAEAMTAEGLAVALAVLMSKPSLRKIMGLRGQEMLAQFAPDAIYDQWEALFASAAAKKGRTRLNVPVPTEEERTLIALQEILARENPEHRPACAKLERQLQAMAFRLENR